MKQDMDLRGEKEIEERIAQLDKKIDRKERRTERLENFLNFMGINDFFTTILPTALGFFLLSSMYFANLEFSAELFAGVTVLSGGPLGSRLIASEVNNLNNKSKVKLINRWKKLGYKLQHIKIANQAKEETITFDNKERTISHDIKKYSKLSKINKKNNDKTKSFDK